MPLMLSEAVRATSRHTIKNDRKVLNKTANQIRQSMSMTQKVNHDSRVYSAVKNKNSKHQSLVRVPSSGSV